MYNYRNYVNVMSIHSRWSRGTLPCILTPHQPHYTPLPVHHHLSLIFHPSSLHCLVEGWSNSHSRRRGIRNLASTGECFDQSLWQCAECEWWPGGGVQMWSKEQQRQQFTFPNSTRWDKGKFCDHICIYVKSTELQVLCTFCIIEIVLISHIESADVFMIHLSL